MSACQGHERGQNNPVACVSEHKRSSLNQHRINRKQSTAPEHRQGNTSHEAPFLDVQHYATRDKSPTHIVTQEYQDVVSLLASQVLISSSPHDHTMSNTSPVNI